MNHTVDEGLNFIATWNASMLQSNDILTAVSAAATKGETPVFEDLT
jgi:delta(3,5)-delta(2,4)-dienoyl-CoA isomerase